MISKLFILCYIDCISVSNMNSFLVFAAITVISTSLSSARLIKETAKEEKINVRFPKTFQFEAECVIQEAFTEADVKAYYDQENNRATVDLLFEGDKQRQIYDFNENVLVNIQDNDCTVTPLSDDTIDSFVRFKTLPSGKKTIGTPEEVFYLDNSTYLYDDLLGGIPVYVFTGVVDIPKYSMMGCNISHMFSKPDFTTPSCDSRACSSIIVSATISCTLEDASLDASCLFFGFEKKIFDDSVFQSPPGVFCERKSKRQLPVLPSYFTFSYDLTVRPLDITSPAAIQTLHKALWYDGDLQLVRVDEYNDRGYTTSTKVFDVTNGMAYNMLPEVEQCSMGMITDDFTLDSPTLLPSVIFPWKFKRSNTTPIYIGKREVHGLNYDVWSVNTESQDAGLRITKDIYYSTRTSDTPGIVKAVQLLPSFIENYGYEISSDQEYKLSTRTYVTVNNFKSVLRDWSVFDVSSCFEDKQKRPFVIRLKGPTSMVNTKVLNELLELLYLRIVSSAGVSVIRISELKTVSQANDKLIYKGLIVENPSSLGFGKNNTEPNTNDAFKNIEDDVKRGLFSFNVTRFGDTLTFSATAFGNSENETDETRASGKPGYSPGAVAAISLVMLVVGVGIGAAALFSFLKSGRSSGLQRLND